MKIYSRRLTLGTKPEIDFVGKKSIPKVTLKVAENYNVNTGTKEDPTWETKNTSWYTLKAFGDVAKKIIDDKLKEGDSIELIDGNHWIEKKEYDGKTRYFDNYLIREYKKYDKGS